MTVSLKHKFVSPKTDSADTGLVRPTNWNDEHDLTMAANRLLGRTTAGTGVAEEITVGSGLTLSSGSIQVTPNTYQSLDAELTAIAGLTSAADTAPYFTGSGTAALMTVTTAGRALIDDVSAAAQRTTLGLDGASTPTFTGVELGNTTDTTITRASAGVIAVEGVEVPLNSVTATHVAGSIELGNALDTTLTRASAGVVAVEGVPLASTVSPAFSGTPTAPTAAGGTNTTQIATTAFVTTAVAAGGGTGRLLRAPQILTSGTSYTTPAGCTALYIELVGGGGGSGGFKNGPAGSGGGASGAYCAKFVSVSPSTAYAYSIGAGGTAGTNATAGGVGGTTTMTIDGVTYSAAGGDSTALANGGASAGGDPSSMAANGDININGSAGTVGNSLGAGGPGGASRMGAGGYSTTITPGYGGGAAGGGGSTNGNGKVGGTGAIRIWEYS